MIEDIAALTEQARSFLEHTWVEWRSSRHIPEPDVISHSMCRLSSVFLADRLSGELPGRWSVVGGGGADDFELGDCRMGMPYGGMLDASGTWQGHWWLIEADRSIIIDVTADQFGHQPVIITNINDHRYCRNLTKAAERRYLAHVARTRLLWEDRWNAQQQSAALSW